MKIVSYSQLVVNENGKNIQKGMNFAIQKTYSVLLMSTEKNAPYDDEIFDDGIVEYEGHDVPKNISEDKKSVDQPFYNASGSLTENGKFFTAAHDFKEKKDLLLKLKFIGKSGLGFGWTWVFIHSSMHI